MEVGHSTGIKLAPATRRHLVAAQEAFNAGLGAATTLWHMPQPANGLSHSRRALRRYAILQDARVLGTCGLWLPRYCGVELTISIFEESDRNRGVGTSVVQQLCDIAFRRLRRHRVELGTYPDNARAIRVYEKCGFQREAVLRNYIYHDGRWRDLLWMSLLRAEWGGRR